MVYYTVSTEESEAYLDKLLDLLIEIYITSTKGDEKNEEQWFNSCLFKM